MNQHYVFVYGTLRKHESNHHLLKDTTPVALQAWTKGSLFDTGAGYPALKESNKDIVYGELYLVSDEQLRSLDQLEDYFGSGKNNLYDRIKQWIFHDTGKIEAYVYVISPKNENSLKAPIKSGDWRIYHFSQIQKPILYYAYGSCMDNERFKLANVDHFFQIVKGRGTLKGYTLRFTRELSDGGRADIVEEGGLVEGKVYEIPNDCLPYLYRREGVDSKCYRPALVDVQIKGKVFEDVLTFIVVNKDKETAPPDHYIKEIIRGGTGFLSDDYMKGLKQQLRDSFSLII